MRTRSSFFVRPSPRSEAGSALIIVLSFVVLLTVVVLAMLSHSLLNRMISNASSNVSKTDIYAHGAIDQVIGDLRQEIVAGSTVAAVTPATGGPASIASPYNTTGTNYIYRPAAPANSVPYASGPSSYGTPGSSSSLWNTTFQNLVKQSTFNVAFEPYDSTVPMRASNVSTTTASLNGRTVSTMRWNKALLLPKASATFSGGTGGTAITISSDNSTATTPNSSFVAPNWIMTTANGTIPTTTLNTSSSDLVNSNTNPKSASYVVGRYAYTIYNEGGLLDANVAGCPSSTTAGTLASWEAATLSRKGPSAFADLTQLPGIADLTTLEGSFRGQHIVDSLVGWRNPATANNTATNQKFPTYTFNSTSTGTYLSYLLGLSSNFMVTGYTGSFASPGFTDPFTGQVLTDQTFSSRQQMISFFENTIAKTSGSTSITTEQAYLQDAMMYLGTFSRTLNQPSYWPDPTRPTVLAAANTSGSPTLGNSAYQLDNTANPPFKSIYVGSNGGGTFTRNDGTTAATGEPLVKKRFALSRLSWLTCDGPIASDAGALNTSDSKINAIVTYLESPAVGMSANFLAEGGPTNIHKYFGLTWVAGPAGQGSPGGYWYYDHGNALSGSPIIGTLSQVAAASRDPDFFELLLAGTNVGGIAKVLGPPIIGATTFTSIQDSTVSAQIIQLGANIIDEANPTQYPTHIVYPFGTSGGSTVYHSAYGAMDLPYLSSVSNARFIVQPSSAATGSEMPVSATAATSTTTPASPSASSGLYPGGSGTGVLLYIPSIWNPYDANGPMPILASTGTMAPAGTAASLLVAPTNLRIVVSSVVTDLNTTLAAPTAMGGTGNQNTAWPGPSTAEWTTASGLGSNPVRIVPSDLWSTPVPNAPSGSTTGTVTTGTTTTTTTTNSLCQGTYSNNWTSESSTELDFSNVSTLYREPTPLMQAGLPAGSNLTIPSTGTLSNAIAVLNSAWANGIPEAGSGNHYIGWLVSTFPLCWTEPTGTTSPAFYLYSVNNLPTSVVSASSVTFSSSVPASGETVRLEYQVGSNWIPYMEYSGATGGNGNGHLLQYNHDFVPMVETGAAGSNTAEPTAVTAGPYELSPTNGTSGSTSSGSLWNNNSNGSGPDGSIPGHVVTWDVRTPTWGFPIDGAPPPLFSTGTYTTETQMPSVTNTHAATSHTAFANASPWGLFEASGGIIIGTKQQNFFGNGSTSSPTTDYYMDPDGTVRRAIGAYVGGSGSGNWTWTSNTTVGLPLASTATFTSSGYTPLSSQFQSRPIILHRPYRSVAELGYVFSNTPYKNIDFSTPESPYSALLDIFCINEDYRPDPVMAGRVDLNTKQAPVLQALLAGAYRDEEAFLPTAVTGTATNLTGLPTASSEAVAISQALVKRTSVGGTNPLLTSLSSPQPLSNIGDLVGRWVTGTTAGTTTTPINGATSYDGFSADLSNPNSSGNYGLYVGSATAGNATPGSVLAPTGNYNIIKRFRESTMRALSDAGQAGTWNLLIDVVAQSGHYPPNASGLSNFLVEGERRYWVHVCIDRSTGQVIDENIEPVNE